MFKITGKTKVAKLNLPLPTTFHCNLFSSLTLSPLKQHIPYQPTFVSYIPSTRNVTCLTRELKFRVTKERRKYATFKEPKSPILSIPTPVQSLIQTEQLRAHLVVVKITEINEVGIGIGEEVEDVDWNSLNLTEQEKQEIITREEMTSEQRCIKTHRTLLALPGETVLLRVITDLGSFYCVGKRTDDKRNEMDETSPFCFYYRTELIKVLEISPERATPRCPMFGECGGCQVQHWNYKSQLKWKTGLSVASLEASSKVHDCIPSTMEYNYRSKITPHWRCVNQQPYIQSQRETLDEQSFRINNIIHERKIDYGRYEYSKQQRKIPFSIRPLPHDVNFSFGFNHHSFNGIVIDVDYCCIGTNSLNEKLPEVRWGIREQLSQYQKGFTVLFRETTNPHSGEKTATCNHNEVVISVIDGIKFQHTANSFFQTNLYILPDMLRHVTAQASKGGLEYMVDAYCGVGLFAIAASSHFTSVMGVELSKESVNDAIANALRNDRRNCVFKEGEASDIFYHIHFPAESTCVVVDPPRKGASFAFRQQLLTFYPRRIIYVSCSPAGAMVRDVEFFTKKYTITCVQPFDLFPQTQHIECVVTLERNDFFVEKEETVSKEGNDNEKENNQGK